MNSFIRATTNCLIKAFIKDKDLPEKVTDEDMRRRYAYLESLVSIVGNLVIALIKYVFGLMFQSIALMADALHSASDLLTSIVVLLGFKISSSPADEKHPYGHGRIEFIATLVIAVMLLFVGVEFVKTAYDRFITNAAVKGSYLVAAIILATAVFKEWMARFSMELGMRIDSPALIADAWHHRTDSISSILVAIALVASKYGYYKADAVLGFGVSALVAYTGITIAIDSISKLIGEVPSEEEVKDIRELALQVPGVLGVHKIKVHNYGAFREISLHIHVNQRLSIIEAHDISDQVEKAIEAKLNAKVTVHTEPLRDFKRVK